MATPGSALLSLRRTVTDAGGVVAVLVTVLLVCTMVTWVVAAVSSWQREALRASVGALPASATSVEVRSSYDAAVVDELDDGVRQVINPVLDVVGGGLLARTETVDHRQPGGRPWPFVGLRSDSEAVTARTGRLPAARATGRQQVEVAAPDGSGLEQGDRLTLVDPLDGEQVKVLVTGTWAVAADAERLLPAAERDALLVAGSSIDELAGRAATVSWRAAPDLQQLTPARLDDLASAAAPVDQALDELGQAASASLQVDNPLPTTIRASAADLTAQRTLLLMPVAVLLLLGAAVALLVAAALATNRADDEGLLRSRGADRRRLSGPAALEAAAICLVGGSAAVALAAVGLGAVGLPVELGLPALVSAGVAAAVCWVALTAPALSRALGGDRALVAVLERRRRRATTLLIAVAVLVLALAVVALLALRRSATDPPSSSGIDPVVVGAPALLLLATTTVLVLVLLPIGFRLSTAGSGTRGLALALGTRSVSRSAARSLPLALVVALVAGALVYAVVERANRAQAVQTAADKAVGADVRVLAPPSSIRAGAERERTRLASLPGVQDVAAVRRTRTFVDDVPVDVVVADLASPAASSLLPSHDRQLRGRLTSPAGDGTVPVALTEALADSASLDPGATFELFVDQPRVLEVVGTVDDVPTVTEGRTAVLLDADALGAVTDPPDEWWLSVADASVDDVERTLAASPTLAAEVLTRSTVRNRLTVDPGTGGTAYGTALLAAAGGAWVLGVVLIASLVLLRRRERAATGAFLRALGASDRDVRLTSALEQTVVTGGGVLVGALAGVVTAVLTRAATGADAEPVLPWATMLPALLALVLVPLVVLLVGGHDRERRAGRLAGRRAGRRAGRWSR